MRKIVVLTEMYEMPQCCRGCHYISFPSDKSFHGKFMICDARGNKRVPIPWDKSYKERMESCPLREEV